MRSTRFLKSLEKTILQHAVELLEQEERQDLLSSGKEATMDDTKRNDDCNGDILAVVILVVVVCLDLAAGNILVSPSSVAMCLGGGAARWF